MKYSGLPEFTPCQLSPDFTAYIVNFDEINASGKNWAAFFGKSGTGKSTQAFTIARALLQRSSPIRVKLLIYSDILQELVSLRFNSDGYYRTLERFLDAELVILDDFLDIIPRPESFEEQVAVTLIKRRYTQRKPLIITTELTPDDFRRKLPRHGEALLGRIIERSDGRVSIAGSDAANFRLKSENTRELFF